MINIHVAKTQFSRLIERVLDGEHITIAKAGKPVARLIPIDDIQIKRMPGSMAGKIFIADDFDLPSRVDARVLIGAPP